MKKVSLALASVSALAATAAPASAALIEKNIKVTANFDGIPNVTHFYNFDIQFDNATDIKATTDGLAVYSSPFGYNLMYSYTAIGNRLSIGNYAENGIVGFNKAFNTVNITLRAISQERISVANSSIYTLNNQIYGTQRTTVTSSPINSAVPEPSTWMMLVLGFGVTGYAMRRKTVLRYV